MADIVLGIESSCDDTSAAVIRDGYQSELKKEAGLA